MAPDARPLTGSYGERMTGRELVHPFEHAARGGDEPQCQILVERFEIQLAQRRIERQQRFDLLSEREAAILVCIEERLLAEMIARREELALLRIPQREGIHPAQVGQ